MANTAVCKFQGFQIHKADEGYWWANGEQFGYFDTLDEAKTDIADYNRNDFTPPEDTPSLNAPWFEAR